MTISKVLTKFGGDASEFGLIYEPLALRITAAFNTSTTCTAGYYEFELTNALTVCCLRCCC